MIIKRLNNTVAKLEKLAAKATPGPWSGEVRETDCIIYPTSEREQEDFTIILENQFPDKTCRHNVKLILALRNMLDTICSDIKVLTGCLTWHDLQAEPDVLPCPEDHVEVLIDGYPTTAIYRKTDDPSIGTIWVSYFTSNTVYPTHWRALPAVGRTVGLSGGVSNGLRKKNKKNEEYTEPER